MIILQNFGVLSAQDAESFTSKTDSTIVANINSNRDTTEIAKNRSGLDTIVVFSSKDTARFSIRDKSMRLRGDAKLDYQQQSLNSEIIIMNFGESTLESMGVPDSSGRLIGFPRFKEMGEEYVGEKLKFNFKTNKGLISLGETELTEGFYFGTKIKRVSESEFFIENGYYTTCDASDPHYYFGSNKMKMIAQDRIFLDPLVFYVEDLPIFVIPFGMYFPTKSGRQSGLIVPSFFFSQNRGIVFEDFGFYWATSDYFDTQLTANFYTKGGYLLKNNSRWKLRDVFDGSARLEYGKTRFNPDDEYTTAYKVGLNHNHEFNPNENIVVNLNFSSTNFNQNTSTNPYDRIQQNITSNASYSKNFDNGMSYSVSFQREQNIIDDDYNQSVPLRFSIPSFKPLKGLVSSNHWLSDVTVSYSGTANYDVDRNTNSDSTIDKTDRYLVSHNPGISISPKLGYFNIRPSINVNANNYFRKIDRTFNQSDSSVVNDTTNGFFSAYWASFSIGVGTKLYGIADENQPFLGFIKPSAIGIKAFRHTWQPNISLNYTPDYSQGGWDYFDTYFDENGESVEYYRYELDGGSRPSSGLIQSLSYSDNHSFEIKMPGQDSTEDENIELLKLDFRGSYNFAADSLNFSDISFGFRTPAIEFINFNGSAAFTLYDDDMVLDSEGNPTSLYRKVNRFLWSSKGQIARLTRLTLSFNSSFSSQGINFGSEQTSDFNKRDEDTSSTLGQRFMFRQEGEEIQPDLFGDNTPGYSSLYVPWSANLGLSYTRSSFTKANITERINLNLSLNFNLTNTLRITSSAQYDFINMELLNPVVFLTKDLHCWQLSLRWSPVGFSRGFFLTFGIKASHLQDLKIEKQSSPIY